MSVPCWISIGCGVTMWKCSSGGGDPLQVRGVGEEREHLVHATRNPLLEDQLVGGAKAAKVRWGMVTPASLKADGANRAWLVQNGKRLRFEVLSPAEVTIESWPADPPPRDYDKRNPGISARSSKIPPAVRKTRRGRYIT